MPRSVIALLYSVPLPAIVDATGQAAVELDHLAVPPFQAELEENDPLQSNELVFQFVAIGKYVALFKLVSCFVFILYSFSCQLVSLLCVWRFVRFFFFMKGQVLKLNKLLAEWLLFTLACCINI